MGSHDFIKFPPGAPQLSTRIWFALGQVQARIEKTRDALIPPESIDKLQQLYLTKGIHATTAIEGNSFSEDEVGRILAGVLRARPSRQYQQQQIDNMERAFRRVVQDLRPDAVTPYSLDLLNRYHEIVLGDLGDSLEEGVLIGKLRQHPVQVGSQYLAAPPEDCPRMLYEFCQWLNADLPAPAGMEIAASVVKALMAHVFFAAIHPYGDGNGRMARLIEFKVLLGGGVPDIAAHLLSNHYNRSRDQYYMMLNRAHGEYRDGSYPKEANLAPFVEYALDGFRDELDDQFVVIHDFQRRSLWHDAIHAAFRREFSEQLSGARQRQKRLILELSDQSFDTALSRSEIRDVSPAVLAAYYGKSNRMLQRDINELLKLRLLIRDDGDYRLNTDILQIRA